MSKTTSVRFNSLLKGRVDVEVHLVEGVLTELGITSHDVVGRLRRILGIKKIGHTGTLDPDASGVLPMCIGRATKTADMLTAQDKQYIAEVTLGSATTTLDAS